MSAKILLFAFGVVVLSSCSVYKTGQTPDDVYYSPAKEVTGYVKVDKTEDLYGSSPRTRSYSEYTEDYRNDRFMRLSMNNSMRWSAFDDYYWNSNLLYNNYYGYNSWSNPWNSYYYWNSFYNPYCSPGYIISNPYKGGVITTPSSRPSTFNYNAYVNRSYNNNNIYFNNGGNATSRISPRYNNSFNTRNSNTSEGNSLRRLFNNINSSSAGSSYYNTNSSNSHNSNGYNSGNSYSQPSSRSYTPSSGSSSGGGVSSGGSSSGGGGISRPGRN